MKRLKQWMIVPTTLAMLLANTGLLHSQTVQRLAPGFNALELQGTSAQGNNCQVGNIQPQYTITLEQDFGSLNFSLQSAGQSALIIEPLNSAGEPVASGRQCVLATAPGQTVEAPGYWEEGTYKIYIVDSAGGQRYTLSISQ
ncbi:MAG: hypothetical protein RID53_03905 [Coleofasciculus sp. B1-GNL1-01]|uniref:hypothetical protein n=1 Tax=Coleofasciculus sp. B1-GNL1-01 TaxID=3068484 RepID=UPI0032FAF45A